MSHKWLTLSGIADMNRFLINTWNTLPESYEQGMCKNNVATDKRHVQQAENPMPAVVISVEAVRVGNAIVLDYLTS
jgi:hypothetical protein